MLTKDIDLGGQPWTPIGKVSASYAFKGIFDGQDFTVKNLNIETASAGNYGLFGYVYGGTVKNLTVSGSITVSGSGSSSYGLGGITGKFDGTGGAMENCVNQVKIDGGQNVEALSDSSPEDTILQINRSKTVQIWQKFDPMDITREVLSDMYPGRF